MMLIVAAMKEELETCMEFCSNVLPVPGIDVPLWNARTGKGSPIALLRSGVGPEKSTWRVRRTFDLINPELMLISGYAGALDPNLKIGDLVAVAHARSFRLDVRHPNWNDVEVDDPFELTQSDTMIAVGSPSLSITTGNILSSPHVLGNPEHKRSLFNRFQASVVDMETAFLAREAAARKIPASALRVISDTVQDSFLAPFEPDSDLKLADRARKFMRSGPISSWHEWKTRTAVARNALRCFWEVYLNY